MREDIRHYERATVNNPDFSLNYLKSMIRRTLDRRVLSNNRTAQQKENARVQNKVELLHSLRAAKSLLLPVLTHRHRSPRLVRLLLLVRALPSPLDVEVPRKGPLTL